MPLTQLVDLKHAQTILKKKYKMTLGVNYGNILKCIGPYDVLLDKNTSYVYVTIDTFQTFFQSIFEETVCPDLGHSIHQRDIEDVRYSAIRIDTIETLDTIFKPVGKQRSEIVAKIKHAKNPVKYAITKSYDNLLNVQQNANYVAIDFEMFERKQSEILEIGYTLFNLQGVKSSHHLIVKDFLHRKNGSFVPNNRQFFNYGTSETVPLDEAFQQLASAIEQCQVVVFHNWVGDVEVINKLIGKSVFESKQIFDTSIIYKKLTNSHRSVKLCDMAVLLQCQIDGVKFHNAGNDSRVTAECFLKLYAQASN